MQHELHVLVLNNTWVVTTLPKGNKVTGCKWVYKVKCKPNGEINRFKACLVVKGYNQIEGLDYKDRFSSIVKLPAVQILIALATHK